jgi:hypothetical protein
MLSPTEEKLAWEYLGLSVCLSVFLGFLPSFCSSLSCHPFFPSLSSLFLTLSLSLTDVYTSKIVLQEEWASVSFTLLKDILKRDTLTIKEVQ